MRIGRTLPPAAAPIYWRDIISGLKGLFRGEREIERFENELKDYFGVKHVFLLSSGKAALKTILTALRRISPDRDEVIIPAFTCYSVPSAIVAAGLKVVPCDIVEQTLDMDTEIARSLIGRQTLALVPCHLFGIAAQVERLKKLVQGKPIFIVEDAAQCMGEKSGNGYLGTLGDVGFFSLGRGKALTTVEGGIITTSRYDIAKIIEVIVGEAKSYRFRERLLLIIKALGFTIFSKPCLFWIPRSLPFLRLGETIYDPDFASRKISGIQAGFALGWEKRIERMRRARKKNANAIIQEIRNESPRVLPEGSCNRADARIRLPILVENDTIRAKIFRLSERNGLGIMPSYPGDVSSIPQLKDHLKMRESPIVAQHIANRIVTVPVHEFVSRLDQRRIADVLNSVANMET